MRLTTDTPKNNLEMALNLFYAKDKEVWVRGELREHLKQFEDKEDADGTTNI